MNTRKAISILGLLLVSAIVLPVARADDWNQATKLTFSQSVQIPGRILPAGTYWFVVVDDVSSRNIVRIFSSDRSTLYATIMTGNAERFEPTARTEMTFAEKDVMPTNAIVTWFFPGFDAGHEFLYSKSERQELARVKHQTVMAMAPGKHKTVTGAD